MYLRDTIAAISTPIGEGGISIIRISGPDCLSIADRIFRRSRDGGLKSHRFYYGVIFDPDSAAILDEAMVVLMRGPNSFTREDVLELHCHGGYLVVRRILALVLRQGARLADPGEFTKRAFLNGRIDLVQAEAIMDIIHSKSEMSLNLAQHQREGLLSRQLFQLKEYLLSSLAFLEAFIDFPEEDIDVSAKEHIGQNIDSSLLMLDELLSGFSEGRIIREGVSVVIAGKPNVGKSSLLNALLQEKRAIVTAIPGTTRDLIEEQMTINGLPVKLLDTAGIRESDDHVEKEGVKLSLEKLSSADLVLFVVDASSSFSAEDQSILERLSGFSFMVVKNKSDIDGSYVLPFEPELPVLSLSTHTGHGLVDLQQAIFDFFIHLPDHDSREFVAISQVRHRDALTGCRNALANFKDNLDREVNLDLLAIDLRDALDSLGAVTGETTADDVLDRIFQQFCIGK
ncbi:tRNA (uridine34-C5)-methyleneglycinetransferase, GTPase subunit [Geotalea daltonii FRC-32]|uniref:tRNA modification GTPase MnmE n=1 Tax=Geotalea daltonii (strain DSM 22248 / JCM 15807 / FRC-32) TaxID=316067 RepID=B9M7R8_GEODF|nr:tRNA uridine-5-carboxymethylaminomethyl(34) synthesis GTPase MnmE [Geotalea daltonii]ACM22174.1 tRNA (uridine34-C5)-methyleneglycinetransferase, GTPase subunit [Geotalea daltonii FRC-32]